jgi:diguanylate cyclase (GGDEF)-like protein
MTRPVRGHRFLEAPQLSQAEQQEIKQKIDFETSKSFHSMVKLGAFANIIGAFFYILAIYNRPQSSLIFYWYSFLVIANLINILWAVRFEYSNITPEEISKCRKGFLFVLILICLIWGSAGILFINGNIQERTTTIIFLLAVLICFSFSTVMDFTMAVVSILCLLSPLVLYNAYLAIHDAHDVHHINVFNMSNSAAFIVLGLFMLIATFFGNIVLLKVFRLGYENALLSKKLARMNKSLEKRVKERTNALEISLKLVTYQATHDLLTELPNERLLYEKINKAMQNSIESHHKFAIACFSLNGMRNINDGIGHRAASKVFQLIAKRFTNVFQNNNRYFIALSRRAQFVILIEPIKDVTELEKYVDDLFIVLNDPINLIKHNLKLSGSIGLSVFPDNGLNVDTLITNAEAARVLAAKRGGNSVQRYNTVINANASRQLNIENLLYLAIEKNELILGCVDISHRQPQKSTNHSYYRDIIAL